MKHESCWSTRSLFGGRFIFLSLVVSCGQSGEAEPTDSADALALVQAPKIENVSMSGSGCADAVSSEIALSGTRDTFRIAFDDFEVKAKRGTTPAPAECTVSVVLEGSEGVQYAPAGLGLAVDADTGTSGATVSTSGFWASSPDQVTQRSKRLFDSEGIERVSMLDDQTLWSSCTGRRELRFTTRLSLDASRGRASVEGLSQVRFHARPCHDGGAAPDAGSQDGLDAAVLDATTAQPDAQSEATALDAQTPQPQDAGAGTEQQPQELPTITSITESGAGCPGPGSTKVTPAASGGGFDVDFGRFLVETTPERRIRLGECVLSLGLSLPAGKTVAIASYSARGRAQLPTGSTAYLRSKYDYTAGGPVSATKLLDLTGPHDGAFEAMAAYANEELAFGECQRARNLNLTLTLGVRALETSEQARVSLESLGKVQFVLRSCP
jgi:hypothetical protein